MNTQIISGKSISWTNLLNFSFGVFFSVVLGYFVLSIAISGLHLATSYTEKDALKKFVETLTSSLKGLFIALGAFFVLNSIFFFLGISPVTNPLEKFTEQLSIFENCLRKYDTCGTIPK